VWFEPTAATQELANAIGRGAMGDFRNATDWQANIGEGRESDHRDHKPDALRATNVARGGRRGASHPLFRAGRCGRKKSAGI
jgi:hypothetical protein